MTKRKIATEMTGSEVFALGCVPFSRNEALQTSWKGEDIGEPM